jgi:flavorubredoxin
MIRNVVRDLYQIGACVAGEYGHEAIRVYVLLNEGQPILIVFVSHLDHTEIMAELEEVLAGKAPQYIFLTHSELPHAGNLQKIVSLWPDIQVIVSLILLKYIEIAPIMPLEQITPLSPGSSHTFAGRELRFVNALLKDQPGSQWIFDPSTGTMFTGDGFGCYHPEATCHLFSDELDTLQSQNYYDYHWHAFRFLRWVLPEKLNAALEAMFDRYPVEILAPTHGNALRGDISRHVSRLQQTISAICHDYRTNGGI